MVLSDNETKEFYAKFEELEKVTHSLDKNKKYRTVSVKVEEIEKIAILVEEIHNIVYDTNEN